jgi:hypothetical protein
VGPKFQRILSLVSRRDHYRAYHIELLILLSLTSSVAIIPENFAVRPSPNECNEPHKTQQPFLSYTYSS